MIPVQCEARLQSDRDGDADPFRCGLDDGHDGPHECECQCGMKWSTAKGNRWQGYDLFLGRRVRYRYKGQLEPAWIRTVQRDPERPDLYAVEIAPEAGDYYKPYQYGAAGLTPEELWQRYEPI